MPSRHRYMEKANVCNYDLIVFFYTTLTSIAKKIGLVTLLAFGSLPFFSFRVVGGERDLPGLEFWKVHWQELQINRAVFQLQMESTEETNNQLTAEVEALRKQLRRWFVLWPTICWKCVTACFATPLLQRARSTDELTHANNSHLSGIVDEIIKKCFNYINLLNSFTYNDYLVVGKIALKEGDMGICGVDVFLMPGCGE